jgi:hypothetical protein
MAWKVELTTDPPVNVSINKTDYCKWCFKISRDDKGVFLPNKIGLDFAYNDSTKKPEIITSDTGADFKNEAGVKESHREVGKGDNKDRQIIWRNVPDKKNDIELCFLIKGKCGNAAECLVSLEHFVDDVWKPLEYDSGEPGDRHDKTNRRKIKGPTF